MPNKYNEDDKKYITNLRQPFGSKWANDIINEWEKNIKDWS